MTADPYARLDAVYLLGRARRRWLTTGPGLLAAASAIALIVIVRICVRGGTRRAR
jgi:hypothetical protein